MREIPIIENVLRMKHAEEMLSFWLVVQENAITSTENQVQSLY